MKVIESKIIEALKSGKYYAYKKGYGVTGEIYHDMVVSGNAYLIGTCYAQLKGNTLKLGVYGGAWKSVTTKSRINAVADAFGVPRIYQENRKWTWGDGVKYDGIREFSVK